MLILSEHLKTPVHLISFLSHAVSLWLILSDWGFWIRISEGEMYGRLWNEDGWGEKEIMDWGCSSVGEEIDSLLVGW